MKTKDIEAIKVRSIEMEILQKTELSKIKGGKTIVIYIMGKKYEIEV